MAVRTCHRIKIEFRSFVKSKIQAKSSSIESPSLLPDVLQLLIDLGLDYGQFLLGLGLNLLLSLFRIFANLVQFLVPLCTDLVESLVVLFPAGLPVLITLFIATLATLEPNSIEKFGYSFGLKNHLSFGLRFPTLRKC